MTMAPSKQDDARLKGEARRQKILSMVQAQKSVSLTQLTTELNVSRMTIHRDLDVLESRGLLRKQRGGVTAESSLLFESNFHYRRQTDEGAKRELARAAVALIEPGNVIMLDESTTTLMMCNYLEAIENVTVISNSLAVCDRLRDVANVHLVITGGDYNDTHQSFSGLVCENVIGQLRSDWAFLSAASVIGECLFHQDQDILRVKRAFMQASERTALLLTAGKFRTRALNQFAELSEFDHILISKTLDETIASQLHQTALSFKLI
ncbi:DeoR/GlpR transcriptional regulator [Cohaesibacter sp. CAU 1516]|uniref:DeoR/GlpR family DNA-binding transcription regulator n=1 Tax=Cohaesibacter sp. CAU 1516 TaxID=2576038 RepID=UPI0010FCF099|nr:DeoR/GlpR family DNA-binding transcription regulator [Cohaesibacter sp. CAU 1516]TLP44196.1 DeoR/GlpR transcriptional regulator [Cohaesibacter sp. CAU 1516]